MNVELRIIQLQEYSDETTAIPQGYKFNDQWVDSSCEPTSDHRYFKVENSASVEVARLDLNDGANRHDFIESTYPIPEVGPQLLEIEFIDIQAEYRRSGIGTWIVRELEKTYPKLQLLALAEESEGFWESLGWTCLMPQDSIRRQLFMSSAPA